MISTFLESLAYFLNKDKGDTCILRYTQSGEGQKFLCGSSQGALRFPKDLPRRGAMAASSPTQDPSFISLD